jgi:hypothetical protein
MDTLFYIKQDSKGRCTITAVDTNQPVTVDMDLDEAVAFLDKMQRNKAMALTPDEPRLFYNRAEH